MSDDLQKAREEGYDAAVAVLKSWAPGFYTSITRQLLESAAEDLERVKPQILGRTKHCTSTKSEDGGSVSPRIPCDGVISADGTMTGGCGEPCSFIMDNQS